MSYPKPSGETDSARTNALHVKTTIWCFFVLTVLFTTAAVAQPSPPNVLFIIIDDLNDYVGELGGHPQAHSPNIDGLAAQGVSFRNAHVQAPLCNPSRVAFMTGISPRRSGVRSNKNKPWRAYLPKAVGLHQAFREAGYRTEGYGKIFHGGLSNQDTANWDVYHFRPSSAVPPKNRIPLNGLDDIKLGGIGGGDWGPLETSDSEFEDHKVASWAVEFLDKRDPTDSQPFFVTVGLRSTHSPWYFPPSYYEKIAGGNTDSIVLPAVMDDDLADTGSIARGWAKSRTWKPLTSDPDLVRSGVHSYLAAVAFADAQVGRILRALDRSTVADNTIVALISDHGFHLSEKQTWQKNKLWEEDTRVPFIIRLPGNRHGGTPVAAPVSVSAIYPTLLELAGIPLPDYPSGDGSYRIDYRSLVPLIRQADTAQWVGPAVTFGRGKQISLRTRDHRFTLYADGFTELFDEQADPNEWFNLAGQPSYRRLVADFTDQAETYLSGEHAPIGYADLCGSPDPDASQPRLMLWRDCNTTHKELWQLRLTSGATAERSSVRFAGRLYSDRGFLDITPVDLEADDALSVSGNYIYFDLQGKAGTDGLDFAFPVDARVCLDMSSSTVGSKVLVGRGLRNLVLPLDLATLSRCSSSESASLGDRVWHDLDRDGARDNREPGLAGVDVHLYDCSGTYVAQTTSDENGHYMFDDLPAGKYRVQFMAPAGFSFSPPKSAAAGHDSDPDPATGMTSCFGLADGSARLGIDAGLMQQSDSPAGEIGDFVWYDLNSDGVRDRHEPGLGSVTIELRDCAGGLVATTVSDASGRYLFDDLGPGKYRVRFIAPPGFAFSPARQTRGGWDSNPDPDTGFTRCTRLAEGQTRYGIDAGLQARP